MSKGLFDLEAFESKGPDDIIGTSMSEASEFANNSNATNCVCNGTTPTNVSIPGGDKETPTAKPYDANSVAIPGGDNEKPTASPVDGVKVSIPSKTTLTDAEYNAALDALQKSFKEGVEVLQMLKDSQRVTESVEDRQARYEEDMMAEAMLRSIEEGPVFEAVDRSDKKEVKKVVQALRSKVADEIKANGGTFEHAKACVRVLAGLGMFAGATAATAGASAINPAIGTLVAQLGGNITAGHLNAAIQQIWKTRLWQVLGVVNIEEGGIESMSKALNEKFKEDLGDYKILHAKANKTIIDVFRTKFGWKNTKKTYFLLVDKKIPKELAEMQELITKVEAESEKKDEGKKEEPTAEEKKD